MKYAEDFIGLQKKLKRKHSDEWGDDEDYNKPKKKDSRNKKQQHERKRNYEDSMY